MPGWMFKPMDSHKERIQVFLKYWWTVYREWPKDYETMEQMFVEFDDHRRQSNLDFEKAYREHMNTCVRQPVIINPLDFGKET